MQAAGGDRLSHHNKTEVEADNYTFQGQLCAKAYYERLLRIHQSKPSDEGYKKHVEREIASLKKQHQKQVDAFNLINELQEFSNENFIVYEVGSKGEQSVLENEKGELEDEQKLSESACESVLSEAAEGTKEKDKKGKVGSGDEKHMNTAPLVKQNLSGGGDVRHVECFI